MKKSFAAALAATCAAGALTVAFATPAAAADVIYTLNQSAAFPNNVNYGTVALTTAGSNVNVVVSLAQGFQFVKTGSHDSFTFNIVGASGYSVTNINPSLFTAFKGASNPSFGSYTDGLECNDCGNGGAGQIPPPLTFTVTGVTLSNFQNNAAGYTFSADIIGNGVTGAVASGARAVVPEPGTWALMIGGFGTAGAMLRRRRVTVAA